MAKTQKRLSERDGSQTLQGSYNDVDASMTTNGFLVGKVGRKIEQTISTTNVAGDTATFDFSEDGQLLYTYVIVYTDSTQAVMISAERTA